MTLHTETLVTKQQARDSGLNYYFTGKPCSRGHVSRRHLTGTCADCQQLATAAWVQRNPGKTKERLARYYAAHPERVKAASVKSKRKAMGIPDATRPKPPTCESCDAGGRQMHLDHDHTTGAFRGWLCNRCNLGLGHLGDTIASVEKILDYLRRNGSS